MIVLRLVANGMMYYLVDLDEGMSHGLLTVWATVGNKIQTYPTEESAVRALDRIQEYPKEELGYAQWDDDEAKIAGEAYRVKAISAARYEFQIVDLSDMVIARKWEVAYVPK
jgi:hypothetical protein